MAWVSYVVLLYPLLPAGQSSLKGCIRIGVFVVPVLLILHRDTVSPWKTLGFCGNCRKRIAVGLFTGMLWISITTSLDLFVLGKKITLPLATFPAIGNLVLTIAAEEVAFRSYLPQAFSKWGTTTAISLSSLAFVSFHVPGWYLLQMMPSASAGFWHLLPPLFLALY
ncbi:MAG: CPBP family glutamic-type intramembrane protease [Pirellulaceae bacterium]|nr:CPBP family glutamic-type intramembrane protease [Pirellulaceae bacterium]